MVWEGLLKICGMMGFGIFFLLLLVLVLNDGVGGVWGIEKLLKVREMGGVFFFSCFGEGRL